MLADDTLTSSPVTLSLIVAMSDNRVIGRDNTLPWKIPGDLQYFKEATWGKPIVMGRKTFESLKRPLPGRTNIVITRDHGFEAEDGVRIVHSLEDALTTANAVACHDGASEVMIIGGAQIYAASLPLVQKLYITQINAHIDGDAFFPEFDQSEWSLLDQQDVPGTDSVHAHSYQVFERI